MTKEMDGKRIESGLFTRNGEIDGDCLATAYTYVKASGALKLIRGQRVSAGIDREFDFVTTPNHLRLDDFGSLRQRHKYGNSILCRLCRQSHTW